MARRYRALGLDDEMPFGQYKGDQIWLIIETDPSYVRWLIEEADIDFELDNEAYIHLQKQTSPN